MVECRVALGPADRRGVSESRVALVTGGSRGIGRACAIALAGAGHRVALCYRSDKEGATETAAAITEAGGE
ncbi:MAG: SDR family NAD(P)-dependent oxidoreductase, partial [Acidimicrobiia bacterium]